MDKAGAYGIQGMGQIALLCLLFSPLLSPTKQQQPVLGAGALFVREIQGDYYTVVGLPLHRLTRELRQLLA